jgi:DNA polymerase III subunit delta'
MGWTVVGQEGAVNVFSRAVASGRVAHAYLFAGPAHAGKTLTALQFAQALNCTGEEPPCGRCRACDRIASMLHPDVEIVSVGGPCKPPSGETHDHSSDNSRDIRICQIRRLAEVVSRAPYEGRWRVIIVEPAEKMNEPTANALLKTLEEPPAQVVIILITDSEESLLDTVRSRARRVAFGGLSQHAIERALRDRWNLEPGRAAQLARLSGGRLGWAVIALNDEQMLEEQATALNSAQEMASAPLAARFALAGELGGSYTRDRARVHGLLLAWQDWWRDLLLIAAGREGQAVHRDRLDTLRPLAAQCEVRDAVRALRAIGEARQHLEENVSPVLALEAMMLQLPELRANPVAERLRASGG